MLSNKDYDHLKNCCSRVGSPDFPLLAKLTLVGGGGVSTSWYSGTGKQNCYFTYTRIKQFILQNLAAVDFMHNQIEPRCQTIQNLVKVIAE